ncbi:MAG: uroporphyrinogen-III synthase [Bacteroidales bacterium]|nr:uroporphyrinogen-III synthase [Bacteroidales bacterium]
MGIKNILISQPVPATLAPYTDLTSKYGVNIEFMPFFKVETLSAKEFRAQRINILDFTAIVFTSKTTIDAFFKLCEELRITVPEDMKYFCTSESIAVYLQKHIVYRKRKIFFGNGTIASIPELIGNKHKEEKFLIASTENQKTDLHKLFAKTKYKFDSAAFVKTIISDLTQTDLHNYDIIVVYTPQDVKSIFENYPDFAPENIRFAAFGPASLKALKAVKITPQILAPTPEAPSVAKALDLYLASDKNV